MAYPFGAFRSTPIVRMVDERCNHAVESDMAVAASLRQLIARSIDYAGLFPPCSLELGPALDKQAAYVRSPDEWMLSTFVLPVARFDEAGAFLAPFNREHPLRVSALGPKKEGIGDFLNELKLTREAMQSFCDRHAGLVSIQQLEMALPKDADVAVLTEARGILAGTEWQNFWEAPANAAEQAIDALAESNASASGRAFAFKLRTGGVTADAFPSAQQIARALVAATQSQVPIKFTAGLHHPVRQYRDEVQAKMHGFLNVLGAGVLAAQHRWDEKQTSEVLECEEAGLFSFAENSFRWRDWEVKIDQIERHRQLVTSFGSCSFEEPREDLRALNLL